MRSGHTVSIRIIGGLAVAAAVLSACSSTDDTNAASQPKAGAILSSAPLQNAAALPSAARDELITYATENANQQRIVVSGTVAVPRGQAPEGGWPVISWAHGTTGIADTCAPSGDTSDGPAHDYLGPVSNTLDQWLQKGYAVVATDYEGMGTPGDHTYLNAVSEANAVTDIVRAARNLDPSVGTKWFAMGHSQGGSAAITTSDVGVARAPELDLLGAVSIAPGSGLAQLPQFIASGNPAATTALGFFPLMVLGAAASDPAVVPSDFVGPGAAPLMTAARRGCIADVRAAIPQASLTSVIKPGADVAPLSNYLAAQDPSNSRPKVPVLLAQGTADTVIAKPLTDTLATTMCSHGTQIDYHTYPGADHRASVQASLADAQTFAQARLDGENASTTC
ncbi:lipase family protein [Gordonia sp. CPCC 205515]|uniref:lipase family protein n=1 Tax=Gordonia sp. CPCC 205515 TaxID=3140791 RepID=UPI003AF3A234